MHRVHIVSMTLDKYLTDNELTESDFGALIGRNQSTVNRLRNGETRPDWPTAAAIAKATKNAVTANDFLLLPVKAKSEAVRAGE